jgi:hypothetical protein
MKSWENVAHVPGGKGTKRRLPGNVQGDIWSLCYFL